MMYHWEKVGEEGRMKVRKEGGEGGGGREGRQEITSIITLELSKNAGYQFLPQS